MKKDLGIRTVFNQLGPLVNPLRPNAQVLGVASEDLLELLGIALSKMGMNRAIVVHGHGGVMKLHFEKTSYCSSTKVNYGFPD